VLVGVIVLGYVLFVVCLVGLFFVVFGFLGLGNCFCWV
jgi:hypothetical protein